MIDPITYSCSNGDFSIYNDILSSHCSCISDIILASDKQVANCENNTTHNYYEQQSRDQNLDYDDESSASSHSCYDYLFQDQTTTTTVNGQNVNSEQQYLFEHTETLRGKGASLHEEESFRTCATTPDTLLARARWESFNTAIASYDSADLLSIDDDTLGNISLLGEGGFLGMFDEREDGNFSRNVQRVVSHQARIPQFVSHNKLID